MFVLDCIADDRGFLPLIFSRGQRARKCGVTRGLYGLAPFQVIRCIRRRERRDKRPLPPVAPIFLFLSLLLPLLDKIWGVEYAERKTDVASLEGRFLFFLLLLRVL